MSRVMMRRSRTAAFVVLALFAVTACGARLTEKQRALGIGVRGAGGGLGGGGFNGTGAAIPGATTGPGGPGSTGTGTGIGGAPGQLGAASCGGAGNTASDVGVTPTQITIATASDITGVQPGLFKSTHEAIRALAAMVNTQGGICGRGLKALPLDTKANSTENRAQVQRACDDALALVGSMSAFDDGGAEVGERCGIPDFTAIPVNPPRQLAHNVFAAFPQRPDKLPVGTAKYIKDTYPQVIKDAAMLYLNAGVTKTNANQRRKAWESVGFRFRYFQEVQVLEANYAPFVQRMKELGIKYVNMLANYQSIQKLLQAMDQADWYPEVRDWDSVAYSPTFVKFNGKPFPPADGSLVFLTTNISEEASGNPEMQLYLQWLSRVAPGAKPDFFGFYAWSAGRLFQKLATEVGPKLTRKALLAAVKQVHSWTGYGIHVDHDVGGRLASRCFLYIEIRKSTFVRKSPSSGFDCGRGGMVDTR